MIVLDEKDCAKIAKLCAKENVVSITKTKDGETKNYLHCLLGGVESELKSILPQLNKILQQKQELLSRSE